MSIIRSKYFLWALLALPSIPMMIMLSGGGEGFEEAMHISGEFAARFMIVAMIATPLRLIFKKRRWPLWLVRHRRAFGVASFGFALIHLIAYLGYKGSFAGVVDEFFELGIWTGWVAFVIFLPLGLTSNNISQRLMGRTWKPLQRWVYVAALFTFAHWVFLEYEIGPALVHFVPLVGLEIYRVWVQRVLDKGTQD